MYCICLNWFSVALVGSGVPISFVIMLSTCDRLCNNFPRPPRLSRPRAGARKDPVRFDSFRFRTFRQLIGSVWFRSDRFVLSSTRFGRHFSDASWLCPVRIGSFPRPVSAGSRIKRFGSVRFGRFGSVSYSFLSYFYGPFTNRRS